MSRPKNFTRIPATDYLQLEINAVCSMVSIPLILHWLPKAKFGVWVLLVQMMGCIVLVDLGMTAAAARLLVDQKDQRGGGGCGSLVKTAALVSQIQGIIIIAAVTVAFPLLAAMTTL